VLIFILPASIWIQILAFALFRFFDVVKPGPIGMIDRHFKKVAGNHTLAPSDLKQILWRGFGIIADDLAAAFFTIASIAILQVVMGYFS
jgi:phosphatidylglycerophosphatase A